MWEYPDPLHHQSRNHQFARSLTLLDESRSSVMVMSEMSTSRIELILDALDFSVVAGSIRYLRLD